MLDAMVPLQPLVLARYIATGQPPQRVGNRHPLPAPFSVFRAADGPIALALLNDKVMRTLCTVIGRPDMLVNPRFATDSARLANEPVLRTFIEEWTVRRSRTQAVGELEAAGVPAAVIRDISEALQMSALAPRDILQDVEHPELGRLQVPQQPVFIGVTRGGTSPAPCLGEHSRLIRDRMLAP
jgi:CoA:oxalate CoA-transferase